MRVNRQQYQLLINVWIGLLGDLITGPQVLTTHLIGTTYVQLLQTELSHTFTELHFQPADHFSTCPQ
jgi:hypothetical protein